VDWLADAEKACVKPRLRNRRYVKLSPLHIVLCGRDKHTYARHVMQVQYFHVQPPPLNSGCLLNAINTALVW